jgi:outer membrane protein, adhesin transport system
MGLRKPKAGGHRPLSLAAAGAVFALAGCAGMEMPDVGMFGLGEQIAPASPGDGGSLAPREGETSAIIADLRGRGSVLGPGPYADVAESVLQASSGAAVAELRIARLKAEARATNWLPSIGPQVSLTSLGDIVASLLVEQVLFDNGKRKAERAFAAADVEVAAVTLAEDMNGRVLTGLGHYLDAERAREQAGIAQDAVGRLLEYNRIMGLRVGGGLSDMGEQQILNQKLAEMQATLASDQAAASAALASLNAMAATPLDQLHGLQEVASADAEALSVVRSRGEGARSVAEARIARGTLLPSAVLTGRIDEDGSDGGVNIGGGMLNAGLGANLSALDAATDLADRKTAEAAEEANRTILALEREVQALELRREDGGEVLTRTGANLEMFTEQYKVGRRSLLELVGQYESFARQERDHAALKYEIAYRQLQIAALRGQLVAGGRL